MVKTAAGISSLLTVLFLALWYSFANAWLLSAVITAATTAYHFLMRLVVGGAVDAVMQNHAEPTKWWYRARNWEKGLYRRLWVKKWKKYLPTYDPSSFSMEEKSVEDIIQAGCQAEIVHEIIVMLSFLPLLTVERLGSTWVFLLTSCAAAFVDLLFVILQRYNRPRLMHLTEQKRKKGKSRT